MKFAASSTMRPACRAERSRRAFTLAEVLAALLFMAIVIPVAVEGLRVASLAGAVAVRKGQATQLAERLLAESIVLTNWGQSGQSGTVTEGNRLFRWNLRSETWNQPATNRAMASGGGMMAGSQPTVDATTASQVTMNLVSIEVTFAVQNRDYAVRLGTLVNSQQ